MYGLYQGHILQYTFGPDEYDFMLRFLADRDNNGNRYNGYEYIVYLGY